MSVGSPTLCVASLGYDTGKDDADYATTKPTFSSLGYSERYDGGQSLLHFLIFGLNKDLGETLIHKTFDFRWVHQAEYCLKMRPR